jgi:hypothetical protein
VRLLSPCVRSQLAFGLTTNNDAIVEEKEKEEKEEIIKISDCARKVWIAKETVRYRYLILTSLSF